MRVVFLVGAGISLDLLPISKHLTDLVLTAKAPDGREARRFSDATYGLVSPYNGDDLGQRAVTRVTAFLNWLAVRLHARGRDYEALFFACRQIHDAVTDEMENALLEPFLVEVDRWADSLPRPLVSMPNSEELAREALNYIGGLISCALAPGAKDPLDAPTLRKAYRPFLKRIKTSGWCDWT